jgi:hypothetical protein
MNASGAGSPIGAAEDVLLPNRAFGSAKISLEAYRSVVDYCARNRLNQPIANGSAEHARILISKLFEIAVDEVVLVTGCLAERTERDIAVYGDQSVLANATRFLASPATRLSIIVQSGKLSSGAANEFLNALVMAPDRQGEVVVYLPKIGALGAEAPHFLVSDQSAFRLETGADAHPANTAITAVANFGAAKAAKNLASHFRRLIDYLRSDGHLEASVTFPPLAANPGKEEELQQGLQRLAA